MLRVLLVHSLQLSSQLHSYLGLHFNWHFRSFLSVTHKLVFQLLSVRTLYACTETPFSSSTFSAWTWTDFPTSFSASTQCTILFSYHLAIPPARKNQHVKTVNLFLSCIFSAASTHKLPSQILPFLIYEHYVIYSIGMVCQLSFFLFIPLISFLMAGEESQAFHPVLGCSCFDVSLACHTAIITVGIIYNTEKVNQN